jgi:8-amino-7-oxononanoate synthase
MNALSATTLATQQSQQLQQARVGSADLFDKCRNYNDARIVQAAGLYPYFTPLEDTEGTEVTVGGRKILMFGSNNYLGLTTDPRVRQAAVDAVKRYGTSCTGSRFLNGTLALHKELERRLAAFVGKQAALVFSTGFHVNSGVISCLVGRGDVVVADKDSHASTVDGCLLALGDFRRFSHNSPEALERMLRGLDDAAGRLVVVEGVYSMGGDIAALPEIAAISRRYGARLMVDDAHSLGVLGGGRGTAAHFGMTDQVDLIMGTFSKSFASVGGFIAGDEEVIHYIQHHARPLIFSAAMPASNVAPVLAAVDIMENEPERVERLWANTEHMRAGLRALGFNTGPSVTPIIPIIVGDNERTFVMWKACFDAGLYVNAVVSPAVPVGMSLLRTSLMATHSAEQIDHALAILAEVGRSLGIIP